MPVSYTHLDVYKRQNREYPCPIQCYARHGIFVGWLQYFQSHGKLLAANNPLAGTTVPDDPAGNQLADNKSHAVANLKVAAGELDDEFHGMVFQDSDVYKWLEEAAYALAYHPDPELTCPNIFDMPKLSSKNTHSHLPYPAFEPLVQLPNLQWLSLIHI